MNRRQSLARAAILGLLAANSLWILWNWWSTNSRIVDSADGTFIALGRLAGLFLAFLALVQILLMARVTWIEPWFGLDKLARLHNWMGFSLTLALVAHPVFLTLGYALRNGSGFLEQYLSFQSWEGVARASAATGLFVVVIATSLFMVWRRLKYETWYAVHLSVYLAVLLAFGHQLAVGRDLQDKTFAAYWLALHAFVLLNLLFFRLVKPLIRYRRHKFKIEKVTIESPDAVSIRVSGQRLEQFRFSGGQFAVWRFLAAGFWGESHPFSFSEASNGKSIRLTVKALGDYTRRLANLKPGTPVILDGPLGVFTHHAAVTDKRLYIAGGIGITPIRSMLGEKPSLDSILLYGRRTEAEAILRNELEGFTKRGLKLHLILDGQADWSGEKGLVDAEKIQRLAPDYLERDIYLCGPWPMMKAIIAALDKLDFPRRQLHFEKFSL
jgi:predicted ferric reductase